MKVIEKVGESSRKLEEVRESCRKFEEFGGSKISLRKLEKHRESTVSQASLGALPGFHGSPNVRSQKVRRAILSIQSALPSEGDRESWRKFKNKKNHP